MNLTRENRLLEFQGFRLRRHNTTVTATDLTFANKRGKKVNEYVLHGNESEELNNLFDQLSESLGASKTPEAFLEVFKSFAEGTELNFYAREVRGVDVAPSVDVFKPIIFDNEELYIEVNWQDFIIRDKRDTNNEPRLRSDRATDSKKLHKLISADLEKFKEFTFQNFHSLFTGQYDNTDLYNAGKYNKNFIGFHHWCAMD